MANKALGTEVPFMALRRLLDREECEQVRLDEGVQQTMEPATRVVDGKTVVDDQRIATGRFFDNDFLYEVLEDVAAQYEAVMDIEWNDFEQLHIIKYGPGGKYDWHMDNEMLVDDDRKLTVVIALNQHGEDFDGGGLDIMWPDPNTIYHFDLDAGDAVVFPSILFHRGVKVDSGERWIVVGWVTGDQYA